MIAFQSACGCGTEQPASVTVYVSDEQFHALLNEDGEFPHETCMSVCEQQGELEKVTDCEEAMVFPAAGVEGTDTGDSGGELGIIWTLHCQGTSTLVCL